MPTRPTSKASPNDEDRIREGWYPGVPSVLRNQLNGFLDRVPDAIEGSSLPIPGARVIIAPHAGYTYSGQCAAWAYKTLDLSKAKRVFILGPSHTVSLYGCAVTTFDKFATTFGDLEVDRDTIQRLKEAAEMVNMDPIYDIEEHSLEMHLPYLYKRLEQTFPSPDKFPPIVPITVGSMNRLEEKAVGLALAPWLKDEENAFIVSSDFCHWGDRFGYQPYSETLEPDNLVSLRPYGRVPSGPPIHKTIEVIDKAAMDAVESGVHDNFYNNLKMTRNTVCGRHPIGVMMAALEVFRKDIGDQKRGQFRVIQYNRSELVERPSASSVSYVSAYAVP